MNDPSSLVTWVATAVGGLVGGGGLVAMVNAFAKRRTVKVDAADKLSDGALRWVDEFQTEAREARNEAASARREAAEAHAQMREIRAEAELLARELRHLRMAILDPNATVGRLRLLVEPPGNGSA